MSRQGIGEHRALIRRPLTWWPALHPLSSVRGRIALGFGLLVLIMAVGAAGSAWHTWAHQSDLVEMERGAEAVSLLLDAKAEGTYAIALLELYVLTGDDSAIPAIRSGLVTATQKLRTARGVEEDLGHEGDAARIAEFVVSGAFANEVVEKVIALRQSGDVQGASAAVVLAAPQLQRIRARFDAAVAEERQQAIALGSRADSAGKLAFWFAVAGGAVGAALALATSVLIARSILKPLSSLESAALAVAGGDLAARAPAAGLRELARLGASFNRMTESLLDASKRRELEAERDSAYAELERERREIEALNRSLERKVGERTKELRRANRQLRQRNRQLLDARAQAATDGLTGLYNHRAFHERIREEAQQAADSGQRVGLIMLDIDGFKRVNDSEGHLTGDRILRKLALSLAQQVEGGNTYRYGGDEFAIVLPGHSQRQAARVAERLRRAVTGDGDGDGATVTVSLGVACFPDTAASAEELIYEADAAMYWAKSAGKNRVGDWRELARSGPSGTEAWYAGDNGVNAPDVVAALVAALAARDPATSAHSQRCSWYAARLAEELRLEDPSTVGLAALLHDIGKLAVPEEVVFKPGPLDEREWALMRQHPRLALAILGQIRAVADACPAILHHHERFDGSGYPDGLAGDEIPIASRILLVIDAFDAMTTERPYRQAVSVQEAVEELQRNAGSQFDPAIVDAFLRVLSRHGPEPLRALTARPAEPALAR